MEHCSTAKHSKLNYLKYNLFHPYVYYPIATIDYPAVNITFYLKLSPYQHYFNRILL